MKVTLTSPGPTTTALTGETLDAQRAWTGAYDLVISADIEIQTTGKPRAAYAALRDRGGLTTVLSFRARRMFATHDEAVQWCKELCGMPMAGTLTLTTAAGTRVMEGAILDKPIAIPRGPAVEVTYTARGGAITTPT